MSSDQIKALVQSLLMLAGGFAVTKGVSADQVAVIGNSALTILGAGMAIFGAVWNHANAAPKA